MRRVVVPAVVETAVLLVPPTAWADSRFILNGQLSTNTVLRVRLLFVSYVPLVGCFSYSDSNVQYDIAFWSPHTYIHLN